MVKRTRNAAVGEAGGASAAASGTAQSAICTADSTKKILTCIVAAAGVAAEATTITCSTNVAANGAHASVVTATAETKTSDGCLRLPASVLHVLLLTHLCAAFFTCRR